MTLSVNHHGTGLRLGMKRSFSEIQGCYRFLYGEDWACPATWCHMGTNGYGENSFENFKTVFIHQYVSRITSSVSEQLSRRWKEPPRHISKTQKIPLVVPDANSVKESSRKNINHPIRGMQVQSHGLDLILEMYCFASFMENVLFSSNLLNQKWASDPMWANSISIFLLGSKTWYGTHLVSMLL